MKTLQDFKLRIEDVEGSLQTSKRTYATSLRTLERISNAIHAARDHHGDGLGERGEAVGAEQPPPPAADVMHDTSLGTVTSEEEIDGGSSVKAASVSKKLERRSAKNTKTKVCTNLDSLYLVLNRLGSLMLIEGCGDQCL